MLTKSFIKPIQDEEGGGRVGGKKAHLPVFPL